MARPSRVPWSAALAGWRSGRVSRITLLGLLIAKYGKPGEPEPQTFADAYRLLHEHGEELFGPTSGS